MENPSSILFNYSNNPTFKSKVTNFLDCSYEELPSFFNGVERKYFFEKLSVDIRIKFAQDLFSDCSDYDKEMKKISLAIPNLEKFGVTLDNLQHQSPQNYINSSKDSNGYDGFWMVFKREFSEVNSLFILVMSKFTKSFNTYNFAELLRSDKMNKEHILCLFTRTIYEENYPLYKKISTKTGLLDCCNSSHSTIVKEENGLSIELRQQFAALNQLYKQLHKFKFYLLTIFLSIVKLIEFYKMATLNPRAFHQFQPYLSKLEFYTSNSIGTMLSHIETIFTSLVNQHFQTMPLKSDYICVLCCELLKSPQIISCTHKFCLNCLRMNSQQNYSADNSQILFVCPYCQKIEILSLNKIRIDLVLQAFIESHFMKINSSNNNNNNNTNNNDNDNNIISDMPTKIPNLDISLVDCGISEDTFLNFNRVENLRNDFAGKVSKTDPRHFEGEGYNFYASHISTSHNTFYSDFLSSNNISDNNIIINNSNKIRRVSRKSKKQQFHHNVQGVLREVITDKSEINAYNQTNMKPASCHQCKSNKIPIHLLYCSSGKKGKGNRSCHKKFCDLCLQRYLDMNIVIHKMSEQRKFKAGLIDNFSWICPACRNICSCASCKRKRAAHEIDMYEKREFLLNKNSIKEAKEGHKIM